MASCVSFGSKINSIGFLFGPSVVFPIVVVFGESVGFIMVYVSFRHLLLLKIQVYSF